MNDGCVQEPIPLVVHRSDLELGLSILMMLPAMEQNLRFSRAQAAELVFTTVLTTKMLGSGAFQVHIRKLESINSTKALQYVQCSCSTSESQCHG